MAILNQPQDEENQQPGQPVNVAGTSGAGASGGQGAGGGAASPVQQNAAPKASQGYTDVASYLNANQGGSQQLGNAVAGSLTDTYNQTKGGIDASARGVQQAAQKGYTAENSDLIKQVASNPVQAAQTQGNAAAVQAQLNDTYAGPTDWADFGTQQGKVNEANQKASLTKAPGGLNVLTQQVEGANGGPQSQGINQLDTLLLGGSPDAMAKVQAAADPYKNLNDYINQQNMAVKSSIGNAQSAADQARTNAQAALLGPTGATGQLDAQVQSELDAARQAATAQNSTVLGDLQGQHLSAATLATLGLSSDQAAALGQSLDQAQKSRYYSNRNFGAATQVAPVDLPSWLTQQSPDAVLTAQNVATPDEYARAQALQQLVGSDNYTTNLTDPTQAGTAPKNLNVFDYLDAQKTAQDFADQSMQQAKDQVSGQNASADAAHAASQHGGFGGFVRNIVNHPLQTISNPISLGNTLLQGGSLAADKLKR